MVSMFLSITTGRKTADELTLSRALHVSLNGALNQLTCCKNLIEIMFNECLKGIPIFLVRYHVSVLIYRELLYNFSLKSLYKCFCS